MSIQLRYAARSDIGLIRKSNQDSGYAGPHLLVLADGMGGPGGGDIASSIAVARLAPLDDDTHRAEELLDLLREAISAAHEDLVVHAASDEALAGLGTTCIAILRSGNKMAMVHIGDSRAYLLRDGELTQVTRDHSFVQFLVETGQLTPEEAEHHPQRSVLLRVLGDSDGDVTLDESVREAVVGDRWLLCSDGLSGVVSAETIAEVLDTVDDPGECCEELVRLALRAGGPDNITCVIADVVDSDEQLTSTVAQVVGAAGLKEYQPVVDPDSPARKAAAKLRPQPEAKEEEAPVDPRHPTLRSRLLGAFFTLLVLGAIAGGLYGGYYWTQTQYYLDVKDGKVMIFQGIPQSIGPLALSHPLKDTGVEEASLSQVVRTRLEKTVMLSSPQDAQKLLRSWLAISGTPTASASPDPTTPPATPSAPAPAASPAPTSSTASTTSGAASGGN